MLSEEEEKAIWYFGEVLVYENDIEQWKIIENLISKLQKELDKKDICLKACEDNLIKERQKNVYLGI